ncbi:protease [Rubrivirga sp.]|uniref:protease n=1 Tax=Rubrivirga sp. TaxID=1885344 RepID=UPI003C730E1B
MTTLYWICLGGGFALTVLMLIVGEVLEAALDALDGALEGLGVDAFDPLSMLAGVTLFGGAGLILDTSLDLEVGIEIGVAALVGIVGAVALHLIYVKPMKRSENSTAFSVREYVGKAGELITGVPKGGFGEVTVRMGASTTFQTAASFSGDPIPTGTAVVVVEVDAEGILRVAPLDTDDLVEPVPTPTRLQTRA